MGQFEIEAARVAKLTAKQRECLHLVVLRKSSKEIARILDISKPAVDQRLDSARRTLDVATRDEAAIVYARAAGDYDRIIYDPAYLPSEPDLTAKANQGDQPQSFMLEEAAVPYDFHSTHESAQWMRTLKEPSGDLGTVQRLAIIVGMTIGILAIVLIGLAVSQSLSGLMAA
ncbi:sigma factor-like helix-turn-helix DNA-binding protein [Sphingorhabdus sp. Alg231-15]|uniref:sigma factor-like helix-turn-helix DNA-binding protein n=1 Tax=Sphingorhabdus sp. Alg231-15 TaxID=1922222 RepID=UPI00307C4BEF